MRDLTGIPAQDLESGWITSNTYLDYESPSVQAFVEKALKGRENASETEKAIILFNAVRDDLRYDPYQMTFDAPTYKASYIAQQPAVYCVPKAILLAAALRSIGIPAAVGFADVQNHLNTPKLAELMETDLFSYHGFVALKLNGKVYKVTPTFNKELCDRFGVQPIEFDGQSDALFHEFDAEKRQHMEYVKDRGIFEEPPIEDILGDLAELYPKLKHKTASGAHEANDPGFSA
ncbi:transglutaminase-like domain-containing protein [Sneathiella sp.]|jgi:transglutaminase-like putative cysteine protease|uniref:transglutaminase-like domain-containing protein n=1 Tax=Sneathiella sp. TaxID=1964365 RepID=UPI0039E54C5D